MIDFVGFGSGWNKQQEKGERRRTELAKAFQEFQRLNPMATAGEFQGFINSMAQGQNFLRGAMPSGDTLNAVIKSADDRRARAEKEQMQKDLNFSMKFNDDFSNLALGIMLNTKGTGEDGTYSPSDLVAMSDKVTDRFPGVDFKQLNINPLNLFNPRKKTEYIQDQLVKLTPQITSMIQSTAGEIDMDLIKKTFSQLPTELWEPIRDRAIKLENERVETYQTNQREKIVTEVQNALENGRTDIYDFVTTRPDFKNNLKLLPEKGSSYWKEVEELARVNLEDKRQAIASQRFSQWLSVAQGLEDRTAKNIYATIAEGIKSAGGNANLIPPEGSQIWTDIQKASDQQYSKNQVKWHTDMEARIMADIQELAEGGAEDIHAILKERYKRIYNQELLPMTHPLMVEYQKQADENRLVKTNKIETDASVALSGAVQEMMKDIDVRNAMFTGDYQNQMKAIRDYIETKVPEGVRSIVFPDGVIQEEWLDDQVKLMLSSLSTIQNKEITDENKAIWGAADAAADKWGGDNIKKATGWFGDPYGNKIDEQTTGKTGRFGQQAAKLLAESYAMTEGAMLVIQSVLTDPALPEELAKNQYELKKYIENLPAFKATTMSLSKAKENISNDHIEIHGRWESQTVQEFMDTQLLDITSDTNSLNLRLEEGLNQLADNPDNQIAFLNDFLGVVNKMKQNYIEKFQEARRRSKNMTGWRTPGSPAWNDSEWFGEGGTTVQSQLNKQMNELSDLAQTKLTEALKKKEEQARLRNDQNNVPSNSNARTPDAQGSMMGSWWSDVTDAGTVFKKINDVSGTLSGRSTGGLGPLIERGVDWFSESQQDFAKRAKVREWLNPQRSRLTEWIVGLMQGNYKKNPDNSITEEQAKEFIDTFFLDIGENGLSAEQLGIKYKDVIQTLGNMDNPQIIAPNQ
ncbi:MAG: hypothetical protein CL557_12450 [Alphaproteobacteria bacterium]|mgnify:CR=1 FL=1|nr:hypothetical protein [Alphaproteobacteria bacterium]|tara:strand:- start:525 stop:3272 length:2748 start_codon:yes stop_codon:yes gene_type:complete